MSVYGSYVDWVMTDPAYAHVSKEFRSAGTQGFSLLWCDQPAGIYEELHWNEFTLQLVQTEGVRAQVDHGVRFDCLCRLGQLALSPTRTNLVYDVAGELSLLVGVMPRAAVAASLSAALGRPWNGDFGLLHGRLFDDPAIEVLLQRLWSEAATGSPGGALLADSVWQTIALTLMTRSGLPPAAPALARGGLSGWQERRTTEYLADNLAQDVPLETLANVAGLSTFHFARAFKQSTGLPPHAYLRRLRLEKAKTLLSDTDLSVTAVALTVGYDSSQALARLFQREVGVSPSRYRREKLS